MLNGMLTGFKELAGKRVTIISGSILHSESPGEKTNEDTIRANIRVVCTGDGGVETIHQIPRSFFQVRVDETQAKNGGIEPGIYLVCEGTMRF